MIRHKYLEKRTDLNFKFSFNTNRSIFNNAIFMDKTSIKKLTIFKISTLVVGSFTFIKLEIMYLFNILVKNLKS